MSDLSFQPVFLVGCPRSGTTWLQLLLGRHPDVATAPETHVFSFYLDRFRKQWELEKRGPASRSQGHVGLGRLLSEDEFAQLCRDVAVSVLSRIAASNPSAKVVLEKSPQHAVLVAWITELIPEARFIHVVRDPRHVAASLMRAGRTWGRGWAPAGPVAAAQMWRRHVEAARVLRDDGDRYREVRYEDLRSSPVSTLASVLDWLGLPHSEALLEDAVAACDLDALRASATSAGPTPGRISPEGFFGRGAVGAGNADLRRSAQRAVETVCSDLMRTLGYERATRGASLRVPVHRLLRRVRDSIDWQLQRLTSRV